MHALLAVLYALPSVLYALLRALLAVLYALLCALLAVLYALLAVLCRTLLTQSCVVKCWSLCACPGLFLLSLLVHCHKVFGLSIFSTRAKTRAGVRAILGLRARDPARASDQP